MRQSLPNPSAAHFESRTATTTTRNAAQIQILHDSSRREKSLDAVLSQTQPLTIKPSLQKQDTAFQDKGVSPLSKDYSNSIVASLSAASLTSGTQPIAADFLTQNPQQSQSRAHFVWESPHKRSINSRGPQNNSDSYISRQRTTLSSFGSFHPSQAKLVLPQPITIDISSQLQATPIQSTDQRISILHSNPLPPDLASPLQTQHFRSQTQFSQPQLQPQESVPRKMIREVASIQQQMNPIMSRLGEKRISRNKKILFNETSSHAFFSTDTATVMEDTSQAPSMNQTKETFQQTAKNNLAKIITKYERNRQHTANTPNHSVSSYFDDKRHITDSTTTTSNNTLSKLRQKFQTGKMSQTSLDQSSTVNKSIGISPKASLSLVGGVFAPLETNIDVIKSLVTIPSIQHEQTSKEHKTKLKFKRIDDMNESDYETKFEHMIQEHTKHREKSPSLVNKLFSIVQSKDKIVIHGSQNKDLMNITERKEVIALAKWYETMSNSVYLESSQKSYTETFDALQHIHQACLQEITRQVTVTCSERGQLFKRVWETLMQLVSEAFMVQRQEKKAFKKQAIDEIQSVHSHCIGKIEHYLPIIAQLTNEMQKMEEVNSRVLLEFRYLRKKNHNLEKSLKDGQRKHKQFKADYNELAKQLDELRVFHTSSQAQHAQEKEKMQVNFVRQLDEITEQSLKRQMQYSKTISNELNDLKRLEEEFEQATKLLPKVHQSIVDELEEKAQKRDFVSPISTDYYAQRFPRQADQTPELEIREGIDGIKLFLASVSTQVEEDLIERFHKSTETDVIKPNVKKAKIQTDDVNIKPFIEMVPIFCQTPDEWNQGHSHQDQDIHHGKRPSVLPDIAMIPHFDKVRSSVDLQEIASSLYDSPVYKYMSNANKLDFRKEIITENCYSFEDLNSNPNSFRKREDEHKAFTVYVTEATKSSPESPAHQQYAAQTSIEQTLKASVEDDISDLHLILNSKQQFVVEVFETIIKHDLLKESPYLDKNKLQVFIEDSSEFKLQENFRFKNIWNKCKLQLIEYVKQQIDLHEKQAEVEEVNKNLSFGNSLYKKLIDEYNDVLDQFNSNKKNLKNKKKIPNVSSPLINLQIEDVSEVSGSGEDSLLDNEEEDPNDTSIQEIDISRDQLDTPTKLQPDSTKSTTTTASTSKLPLTESKFKSKSNESRKLSVLTTSLSPMTSSNAANSNSKLSMSNATRKPSMLGNLSSQSKLDKRLSTISKFNSPIPESSKESESGLTAPPSLNMKAKQRFSKAMKNLVIQTTSAINSEKSIDDSVSEASMSTAMLQSGTFTKKIALDAFNNQRYKKQKQKKKFGVQSSANSEIASNFFSTHGVRIMSKKGGKFKGPIFTEPNVRKYISSIYNEKIKQTKLQDRSNPLHCVVYDFFINKFGFRKLAEKNLQQLLRSLLYHHHLERVKIFVRFYGLDDQLNYDKEDFNFYIDCLIHLDDNLPPIFQQLSIYAIPRVTDLLFKWFETRVSAKVLTRIKSDIESMKFVCNDPNLKNKNVIDQDLALQYLLSAKQEEKKVNILALRPVYLAGDIDKDEVIGFHEFGMLARHIEKGINELSITQLFFGNTDLIDEVTGEKTLSFQQFTSVAVEYNLFTFEKHHSYSMEVAPWDHIRSITTLQKHWKHKKDILRLRLVKAKSYLNFYRLMVQRIDEYFQAEEQQQNMFLKVSLRNIPLANETSRSNHLTHSDDASNSNIMSKSIIKSTNNIPFEKSKEDQEKQEIVWLIYRFLDDESKRVLVQPQVDELIPQEFLSVSKTLNVLAKDNKLGSIKLKGTTLC